MFEKDSMKNSESSICMILIVIPPPKKMPPCGHTYNPDYALGDLFQGLITLKSSTSTNFDSHRDGYHDSESKLSLST